MVSQANWMQILKHYVLKVMVDDVQAYPPSIPA